MKYKLVISDFDGTLLRDDNTVSRRTVKAIRAYIDAGGVFTVSTGRMCKSILMRLPDLGLDKISIPLMGYQGAMIIDNLTNKRLFYRGLSSEDSIKIVKDCEKLGLYTQIYCGDEELYVAEYNYISEGYRKAAGVKAEAVGVLSEFLERTGYGCHKVLAVAEPERALEIMNDFNERYGSKYLCSVSHPTFVEIVNPEGGKGNAARFWAAEMGISMDEVIGIGDSLNDLPLIEAAGRRIAVANARDELKAAAGEVSKYTNNEDAAARILEEIIKG